MKSATRRPIEHTQKWGWAPSSLLILPLAVFLASCGDTRPIPDRTYADGVAYVPCQAIDNLEEEETVELDGGCDE